MKNLFEIVFLQVYISLMHSEIPWTSQRYRQHWGHLALLEEWHEPLMLPDHHGELYVADTKGTIRWKLLCDCGYEFTIDKSDFPGRSIARSCCRPECPYTQKPKSEFTPHRPAMGRPITVDGGANHTVYLPRHVGDAVRAYAAQRKLSFSAATTELVLKGVLANLVDE